jgi:hypothetical protein
MYYRVIKGERGWVGDCRRDLLDHVIVMNERHLALGNIDGVRQAGRQSR